MNDQDHLHLVRCVDLAEAALKSDNDPFGSILVGADGSVLFEDHNRTAAGDETRHPEFEIVKWSVAHMSPAGRAAATVYTSGEHCPMCAAGHAWEVIRPRRTGLRRNRAINSHTDSGTNRLVTRFSATRYSRATRWRSSPVAAR